MSNILLNKVNYVGLLYELCIKERLQPVYTFDKTGPDHFPEFLCTIVIHNTNLSAKAKGATKMQAKHNASKAMFDLLTINKSPYQNNLNQNIGNRIKIPYDQLCLLPKDSSKKQIDKATETYTPNIISSDINIFGIFFINIQNLDRNLRSEIINIIKDICFQDESKVNEVENMLNQVAKLLNCKTKFTIPDIPKISIHKIHSFVQLIPIGDNDNQIAVVTTWASSFSFSNAKMCSMKMMFLQIEWLLCYFKDTNNKAS